MADRLILDRGRDAADPREGHGRHYPGPQLMQAMAQ